MTYEAKRHQTPPVARFETPPVAVRGGSLSLYERGSTKRHQARHLTPSAGGLP